MGRFEYAFTILVVSDGMYSINLGGFQADLKWRSGGGGLGGGTAAPQEKTHMYFLLWLLTEAEVKYHS
jgi:hypothetical protein